ncbi:MAG: molecular chaperone SurA, partial [Pseudomonadales bacterium]|nr:molecular chaperone SurA [Pseudomonadales bacterium]
MQTRLASLPGAFNNIFLTLALCVVSLGASHPSYAEYQLLDRIVAIADDDAVLASHVRDKMQQIKSVLARRGAAVPPDSVLYEQVLERAIIDSLQLQRAYKAGMRVSDQELNEAMERIAAQNRMSLQQFREALEQSGQSYLAAREQTREEILMRRIQQRSVMRKMSITQSEVDNFLASEQGQKLLQPEFNIDHILLPLPASASDAVRE